MSDLSDNLIHIKKTYASEYTILATMFQDWSQQDILSVLEECNGDAHIASLRISDGTDLPNQILIMKFISFE